MKKIVLIFTFFKLLTSCSIDEKGFEFKNFKNTPVWELAKAVSKNDIEQIRVIVTESEVDIDFKDPVYQKTLLTMAIVNKKEKSFLELLRLGANPNLIVGQKHNSSPITEAILHQSNCQLFYIENLLKYGANPNLEIIPNDESYFPDYYPLFTAIRKGDGNECLDILKLLIKYGADINCCSPRPENKNICEGVINRCIKCRCMGFMRYFIIEKKINLPKTPFIYGYVEGSAKRVFTLKEILNTEDFIFEDFESETGKQTFSKEREIRNEILEYLKKTGQE